MDQPSVMVTYMSQGHDVTIFKTRMQYIITIIVKKGHRYVTHLFTFNESLLL